MVIEIGENLAATILGAAMISPIILMAATAFLNARRSGK